MPSVLVVDRQFGVPYSMRILFQANYFPPEVGTAPHLSFEMAESLVELGHQVTVVTGFPKYNVSSTPVCYRHRWLFREKLGQVDVVRIRSPFGYGNSRGARGLWHMTTPLCLGFRSCALAQHDVMLTFSPPVVSGLVARCVSARHRMPWVVNVQDLFPQSAIDLGLLKNGMLIRFFEQVERHVYRKADAIIVMSQGNRDFVVNRGGRPDRIHVVPNWVDTDAIYPAERMNSYRQQNDLGEEFVVLFAGTMGWSQGLNIVIEAARLLQEDVGTIWLLVGDGIEKSRLQASASGLPNVRFLPMQPKETYPQVLAAADICLATLHPEVATPTVPSKVATIMAAGRPVVASFPEGDAAHLIREAACGIVVRPGDPSALAGAIANLRADHATRHRMGLAGRSFVERHLSRPASAACFEEVLRYIAATRNNKSARRVKRHQETASSLDSDTRYETIRATETVAK